MKLFENYTLKVTADTENIVGEIKKIIEPKNLDTVDQRIVRLARQEFQRNKLVHVSRARLSNSLLCLGIVVLLSAGPTLYASKRKAGILGVMAAVCLIARHCFNIKFKSLVNSIITDETPKNELGVYKRALASPPSFLSFLAPHRLVHHMSDIQVLASNGKKEELVYELYLIEEEDKRKITASSTLSYVKDIETAQLLVERFEARFDMKRLSRITLRDVNDDLLKFLISRRKNEAENEFDSKLAGADSSYRTYLETLLYREFYKSNEKPTDSVSITNIDFNLFSKSDIENVFDLLNVSSELRNASDSDALHKSLNDNGFPVRKQVVVGIFSVLARASE